MLPPVRVLLLLLLSPVLLLLPEVDGMTVFDGGGNYVSLADKIADSRSPQITPKIGRSISRKDDTCLALKLPGFPAALPASRLTLQEKLWLSPLVLQAKMVSRSSSYNGLYFASFRVNKVLKGRLPKKLRRHIRLIFRDQTAQSSFTNRRPGCDFPPRFPSSTRTSGGRRFLLFARRADAARTVAVAPPEPWGRAAKRAVKKTLCRGCGTRPAIDSLPRRLTSEEGSHLKVRCRVRGNPEPRILWFKNGARVRTNFRTRIKDKKAINALGQSSQFVSIKVRYSAVPDPSSSVCPISSFCLNGGTCLYYDFLGELVCRCPEGFAGQRCQFKKARIDMSYTEGEACGPYGHDIHFREVCAAWKRPPVTQMTRDEFRQWKDVERQVEELKRRKEEEEIRRFKTGSQHILANVEALAMTQNREDQQHRP